MLRACLVTTRTLATRRGLLTRSKRNNNQEHEVEKWSASEVSAWMKENLNLNERLAKFISSNNINGSDIMRSDGNLSSLKKMYQAYPNAHEEVWNAISELRAAVLIPTKLREREANIGFDNIDENIPFVGRSDAVNEAILAVTAHIRVTEMDLTADEKKEQRGSNYRLFVVGAPGIGKTRFAKEFPSLLAEHQYAHSLKEKLKIVRTVRITFTNDYALNPAVDLKWKKTTEQVNWIMTSRAVHATYQIESSYESWAKELATTFGDTLPSFFNMDTFAKTLTERDQEMTSLYLHMDEVQTVQHPSVQHIGRELLHAVIDIYAVHNSKRVFTLLLFTGTLVSPVKEMLYKYIAGIGTPSVTLPMETLSDDEVKQIFKEMKQQNKLPWLQDDWEKSVSFMKLLSQTGGVPRIIQELLRLGKTKDDTNSIAKELPLRVRELYQLSDETSLNTACNLALAGIQFDAKETKDLIEKLRQNGYLFYLKEKALDVPLLYLKQSKQIEDVFKDPYNSKLNDFWSQLFQPSNEQLPWRDFLRFTLLHAVLRVNALINLGHKTVSVAGYCNYEKGIPLSTTGEIQFNLEPRSFVELKSSWPESGWPVIQHGEISLKAANMTSHIFLNTAGSAFGGFEFVQIVEKGAPQYYIIAHQNQYTAGSERKLTSKQVNAELKRAEAVFTSWKNNKTDDQELNQLKDATKKVILVIHSREKSSVVGKRMISDIVEVFEMNDPAYFGPLRHVIKFFN